MQFKQGVRTRHLASSHLVIRTSAHYVHNPIVRQEFDPEEPCCTAQCCCFPCCPNWTHHFIPTCFTCPPRNGHVLFLQACFILFALLSLMMVWSQISGSISLSLSGEFICNTPSSASPQPFVRTCDLVPWSSTSIPGCRWTLWLYATSSMLSFGTLVARLTLSGLTLTDTKYADDLERVFGRKVFIHKLNLVASAMTILALLLWLFGCHLLYLPGVPTDSFSPNPTSALTFIWYALFIIQAIAFTVECIKIYGCKRCRIKRETTVRLLTRSATETPSAYNLGLGSNLDDLQV